MSLADAEATPLRGSGWSTSCSVSSLFEADQLVPARQHIVTGQELCERAGLRITMLGASEWYEVLGLHLLGEPSRAWQRLEAIRRDASRAGIERVAMAMTMLGAELLLLEGDPVGARGPARDAADSLARRCSAPFAIVSGSLARESSPRSAVPRSRLACSGRSRTTSGEVPETDACWPR